MNDDVEDINDDAELSATDLDDGTSPAPDDGPLDDSGAEDAFLASLKPSEAPDEGARAETDKGDKKPAPTPVEADLADDALVSVQVGEETHKVSAKDLRALFAQRQDIASRSEALTAASEQAVTRAEAAKKIVQAQLERAEARFKPYAELDFLILSKRLDEATLVDLRKEAQAAYDEVAFMRQEAANVDTAANEARAEMSREQAKRAIETLEADFPKEFDEPWSNDLYKDLMTFAKGAGLKNAEGLVDPAAIKLIRMAQLYQKGKAVAKEALKPGAAQPRKPLRSASTPNGSGSDDLTTALSRLRRSGSADDAEAAFAASLRRRAD